MEFRQEIDVNSCLGISVKGTWCVWINAGGDLGISMCLPPEKARELAAALIGAADSVEAHRA